MNYESLYSTLVCCAKCNHVTVLVFVTVTEQQQFVADIERLTSDKADLLTRLQCCEEDLKTANECENCDNNFQIDRLHFSIENERESYFRYDGSSTQEGH